MQQIDFEKDRIEVLCEFFETIIQSILYVRNIYPSESFEKTVTRGTNQMTYTSRYSEIRDYIGNCVLSMKPWLKQRLVKQLVLSIIATPLTTSKTTIIPIERFVIELELLQPSQESITSDMSQQLFSNMFWLLRDFYVKVHSLKNQHVQMYQRVKQMKDYEISFRIQVHVKNSTQLLNLENKLDWCIGGTQEEEIIQQNDQQQTIIPIKSMNDTNGMGIQMQLLLIT
jgi:hypothetical protein